MKRLLSIILCMLMLISVCAISPVSFAATGNTYYVDSIDGDNIRDGRSPETAWRDLDGFANCTEPLKGGDTVLFR